MHEKAIWKPGIHEIAKAPRGNATRGVYRTPYETPAARDQRADAHWVIAYFHKTKSLMKNEGQQKWLNEALYRDINQHYFWIWVFHFLCR